MDGTGGHCLKENTDPERQKMAWFWCACVACIGSHVCLGVCAVHMYVCMHVCQMYETPSEEEVYRKGEEDK